MVSRPSWPTTLSVDPTAWVAPGAVVVGNVSVGCRSSIWFGCVVRGDLEPVRIGDRTNVQDLTLIHVDRGHPVEIGDGVPVGAESCVEVAESYRDGRLGGGPYVPRGNAE